MCSLNMEEGLRNRVILVLLILNIIFIVATLSLSSKLNNKKDQHLKELQTRIEIEEKMYNMQREKKDWDKIKKSLEDELAQKESAYNTVNEDFLESQEEIKNLREELDKVIKLKETLEEDLKEALISSDTSRKRRKPK